MTLCVRPVPCWAMGNTAVTFTDLVISLRDEADVGVGPEVGGQRQTGEMLGRAQQLGAAIRMTADVSWP